MPRRSLKSVLTAFLHALDESRRLASDAHLWASPPVGGKRPTISRQRRDSMTELAFLRAFLAWEAFLAESFVLYLAGHRPPRGRAPKRYTFPPSLKSATDWVVPEGREYAEWTGVSTVITRAQRFFEHGRPYADVLANNRNALSESKTIRNSIAHASATA